MTRTIQTLITEGRVWIEDGAYMARDPADGMVCSLWEVGKEKSLNKAFSEGYASELFKEEGMN